MNEDQAACEREWLKWTVEEVTASRVVSTKPCFVSFISISPANATLVFDCGVYDGETTTSQKLFTVEGQFVPRHIHSHPPIPFKHGLYIDFTTNIGSVTLQYKHMEK